MDSRRYDDPHATLTDTEQAFLRLCDTAEELDSSQITDAYAAMHAAALEAGVVVVEVSLPNFDGVQ